MILCKTILVFQTPAKHKLRQARQRQPQQLQHQLPHQPVCLCQDRQEHNMAKHNVSLYRSLHQLRKGNLHRALGVSAGEKIPDSKLAVHEDDSEHVKHMKSFARTISKFKH
jgi:hypothetical protein